MFWNFLDEAIVLRALYDLRLKTFGIEAAAGGL
jgi:hypothetical protein